MTDQDGRSPASQGRAATASQPSPKTVSGIAGIPNAEALVRLMDDYQNIPSKEFWERYPTFVELRNARQKQLGRGQYDTSFELFLAIAEDLASGIEAATADETRSGSAVGESQVGDSRDAQTPPVQS